jgi:hypothetical protein
MSGKLSEPQKPPASDLGEIVTLRLPSPSRVSSNLDHATHKRQNICVCEPETTGSDRNPSFRLSGRGVLFVSARGTDRPTGGKGQTDRDAR